MVMALVEGETLSKRLMREQRLAPEAIERLLFPLLDGLEQVHAHGLPASRHQAGQHHGRCQGRPTLIDFGAVARGDGRTLDGDDGDLHAGLCRGRAVHLGQAGSVDRHLGLVGHALPRHHRAAAAERDRPHR